MAGPSERGEGRDRPRGGDGEEEDDGPVGTYSAVTPTTAGGTPPAGELKSHGAGGDPWAVPAAPDAVGETSGSDGTGPAPGPRRGPPPPRAGSGAPMAHEDYGHRVFVGGVPVRARPAPPRPPAERRPAPRLTRVSDVDRPRWTRRRSRRSSRTSTRSRTW